MSQSFSSFSWSLAEALAVAALAPLAAVGCGESAASGPPVASAAGVGTTYTTEISISATSWRNVGEGDLTLVRIDSPDSFAGELACHSSPSAACGNGSTSEADLGPKIYTRRAPQAGEMLGDGNVPPGRYLCCGAVSGAGGKVTVSYLK